MAEYVIFALIILIASILQTSTGFGFSIMATPFLLLIYHPYDAIQINLVLSLIISAALIMKIKDDIDWGMLKRFIVGSIMGLPIGIIILLYIKIEFLKLGVGILILLLTILLIFRFRLAQKRSKDITVGGFSGLLTASIGMPGPPLLLYFSGTDAKKEKIRGTTLAFYLFIYFISLIIHIYFASTSVNTWISSAVGLPFVVVGLYIGQILFKYINQTIFRIFTYGILLLTGIYLLIDK